jgi:hypothetical protein
MPTVPPPPPPDDAWDNAQTYQYDGYDIQNEYTIEPGVMAMPVAATAEEAADPDFEPVVTIQLHVPYRRRRVRFEAKKKNTPPVLPAPADTGAFTFLGGSLAVPSPVLDAELRDFTWTAVGQYEFVETAKASRGDKYQTYADGFVLGMQPWLYVSQIDNAYAVAGEAIADGGAALDGGLDVQAGALQGKGFDFSSTTAQYNTPSYYPPEFFNNAILNGGPPLTT